MCTHACMQVYETRKPLDLGLIFDRFPDEVSSNVHDIAETDLLVSGYTMAYIHSFRIG